MCPDNIFANKRIDKLKGRDMYEIISNIAKIGFKKTGISLGIKNKKKLKPNLFKEKKVKPNQKEKAKLNVVAIELVIVKEYGKKPTKFVINIKKINKKKKVKIFGYIYTYFVYIFGL